MSTSNEEHRVKRYSFQLKHLQWWMTAIIVPIAAVVIGVSLTRRSEGEHILSGRVMRGAKPVANLSIDLSDKAGEVGTTKTGMRGTFKFFDIKPGRYFIQFDHGEGLAIVPIEVGEAPEVYVPIAIDDLAKVTFVSTLNARQAVFLDGQRIIFTEENGTGRVLSFGAGNDRIDMGRNLSESLYFVTKGMHEYKHLRAEDGGPASYKEVETVHREFLVDDYVYLKSVEGEQVGFKSEVPNKAVPSVQWSLRFRVIGYKGRDLLAVLRIHDLVEGTLAHVSGDDFQVDGGLGLSRRVRIADDIATINSDLPLPVALFEPYHKVYLAEIEVRTPEGESLFQMRPYLLLFATEDRVYTAGASGKPEPRWVRLIGQEASEREIIRQVLEGRGLVAPESPNSAPTADSRR